MTSPRTITLTRQKLGEELSKSGLLRGDEDIQSITLTKPRTLLIRTERVKRAEVVKEA